MSKVSYDFPKECIVLSAEGLSDRLKYEFDYAKGILLSDRQSWEKEYVINRFRHLYCGYSSIASYFSNDLHREITRLYDKYYDELCAII